MKTADLRTVNLCLSEAEAGLLLQAIKVAWTTGSIKDAAAGRAMIGLEEMIVRQIDSANTQSPGGA